MTMESNLTGVLDFYVYMILGIDFDSFSYKGGEYFFRQAENIVTMGQSTQEIGWTGFGSERNRHALLSAFIETRNEPFRQLWYTYHRLGLDEMSNNVERGRTNVTTALETNLKKAHEDKPMSLLPQIWTDYKKDELANIYKGKGTQKEKESVYEILFAINASQNATWEKIKQ